MGDPVTCAEHPVCSCSHPKWLNDSSPRNGDGESMLCEMNKFDSMMFVLARCNRDFRQVIACDREFQLFTRTWCIAEIYVAHEHCMKASLIVHSTRGCSNDYATHCGSCRVQRHYEVDIVRRRQRFIQGPRNIAHSGSAWAHL